MANRGIVKPETFLRLPEMPANHVFEIVDADHYVRVEGIDIVHRDKPGRHVPFVPTCLLVGLAKIVRRLKNLDLLLRSLSRMTHVNAISPNLCN
jgi:hypothetical protein